MKRTYVMRDGRLVEKGSTSPEVIHMLPNVDLDWSGMKRWIDEQIVQAYSRAPHRLPPLPTGELQLAPGGINFFHLEDGRWERGWGKKL